MSPGYHTQSQQSSAMPFIDLDLLTYDFFCRNIASFFTGKEASTWLVAIAGSKGRKYGYDFYAEAIINICKQRCAAFLSINASLDLQSVWKEQSDILNDYSLGNMKNISEFFAFLDYCEVLPRKMGRRLDGKDIRNADPKHLCWIVATGCLGESHSPVMLSTPQWRRELMFLGHQWLNPDTSPMNHTLKHFFPFEDEEIESGVENHIAVLSWKDEHFLAHQHYESDIDAGMVAYHGDANNSCLIWLPKATCEMYPNIRSNLKQSEQSWLLPGTLWNNDMLCSYELVDGEVDPIHLDSNFIESILSLLKATKDWYPEWDA